jgi:hypothetical protein
MPFGNLRRRWEDNIKMVLREIDYVLWKDEPAQNCIYLVALDITSIESLGSVMRELVQMK